MTAYFGEPWESGVCDTGRRVDPPDKDTLCILCNEGFEEGAQGTFSGWNAIHRECSLRSALGGIGHNLNHQKWCVENKDPDGGFSYRESALMIWQLVTKKEYPKELEKLL